VSWQPRDLSPDARRAAEATAEAAGLPLKDWFAETVRAAVIRELGSLPSGDAVAELPEPATELLELRQEPAPEELKPEPDPEPAASAIPFASAPSDHLPPPLPEQTVAPEPEAMPEPKAVSEVKAVPEPTAVPEPKAEPAPPGPAKEAPVVSGYRHGRAFLEAQRLADRGLAGWLATRIEGLPAGAAPVVPSAAKPSPIASPAAQLKPQLDLFSAPAPKPAPPPEPPRPVPSPISAMPPPAPAPAPSSPAEAAPLKASPGTALPLSLPAGPVVILPAAALCPARIRSRRSDGIDTAIPALAASVAAQGVSEPILVRRLAEDAGRYEVVAGERRRLAAERVGRADLPAVVVEADDAETLMLSLAENLGRGDFSPVDEGRAYLRMLTEFRVSPGVLAQRLARERSHIVLALRLLGLPEKVRHAIDSSRLASAQAYALLSASDPEAMAAQMLQGNAPDAAREPA